MNLRKIGIISCLIFYSVQQTVCMNMYNGFVTKMAAAKEHFPKISTSMLGIGGALTFVGTTVLTGGVGLPLMGIGAYCAYYRSLDTRKEVIEVKKEVIEMRKETRESFARVETQVTLLSTQVTDVEASLVGQILKSATEVVSVLRQAMREGDELTREFTKVETEKLHTLGKKTEASVNAIKDVGIPRLEAAFRNEGQRIRDHVDHQIVHVDQQVTNAMLRFTELHHFMESFKDDEGVRFTDVVEGITAVAKGNERINEKINFLQRSHEEHAAKMDTQFRGVNAKMDAHHEAQQIHQATILSKVEKNREDVENVLYQVMDQGEQMQKELDELKQQLKQQAMAAAIRMQAIERKLELFQVKTEKKLEELDKQGQEVKEDLGTIKQGVVGIQNSVTESKDAVLDALSKSGKGALVPTKKHKKGTKTLSHSPFRYMDDENMEKVVIALPLSDLDSQLNKMGSVPPMQVIIAAQMDPRRNLFRLESITVQSQNPDPYNIPLERHYLSFEQDRQLIESLSKSDVRKVVRTQSGPASVGRNASDKLLEDNKASHQRTGNAIADILYASQKPRFTKNKNVFFSGQPQAGGQGLHPFSAQESFLKQFGVIVRVGSPQQSLMIGDTSV